MGDVRRWKRIDAILDELLELPAEARPDALDRLTSGDRDLRAHVEGLLRVDDTNPGILDRGIGSLASQIVEDDPPPATALPDTRVGPYRIVSELGRGGMGTVYLAERQDAEFQQRVALKLIRGEVDSVGIVRRFRRERRILARLRHPNIAALYDGGETDDGLPYFAMELVEGTPIDAYCDAHVLGIDARLLLFDAACHAVQYAHRNLVVHRDLKPSNVLVTEDGSVKLLDFGIAKLLETDADDPAATANTGMLFTPTYAAPEQILGEPTSTATDVYTLGVLLYVLLTGQGPHGDTANSIAAARAILENDPLDPAARFTHRDTSAASIEVARRRDTTPATLRRKLSGDLRDILRMSLEKQPDRRYPSVEDIRLDLERHRLSMPVRARKATRGYRARKFVRRHRTGAIAVSAVLLVALTGIGAVLWQANVAASERDRARAISDYLVDVFSAADPSYEPGAEPTAAALAVRGAERLRERFPESPRDRAEMGRVLGRVLNGLEEFARAESLLRDALADHELIDDDTGRWDTLAELYRSTFESGRYTEAFELAEELLDSALERHGTDHRSTLWTLERLAHCYQRLGRMDDAGDTHRRIDEIASRVFAEADPAALAIYREHHGTFLAERGDFPEAERVFRAAADAFRSRNQQASLSRVLSSLGATVGEQGRFEESRVFLTEAVQIARVEYGERGNTALAAALTNLGYTLLQLNQVAAADSVMQEAYTLSIRHLGPDHWESGYSRFALSLAKEGIMEFEHALALCDEALATMGAALGERHPMLGAALTARARYLRAAGRLDEAETAYRSSLEFHRGVFGESNPYTTHPLIEYAALLRDTGELAEAEELQRRACNIRDAALEPGPLTVETHRELASIVAERGRRQDAIAILESVIASVAPGLGATDEALATAREELARIRDARPNR